jgi:D-aminoacyl-tRNA deacylase
MRVVLQRVQSASVTIEREVVGQIGQGLLILLGIQQADTESSIAWMLEKILNLRIFEDENGKMNRSLLDINGSVLIVSQFTLYADCRKGRRPSFVESASPIIAEPLYEKFILAFKNSGVIVQTGRFGADMKVDLCNDGPVTIILDHPQID